jgi:hypothetical protein
MPISVCTPRDIRMYSSSLDRGIGDRPFKRVLLKAFECAQPAPNGSKPWVVSDTSFPAGSEFMADYKGKTYSGILKNGLILLIPHEFGQNQLKTPHFQGV